MNGKMKKRALLAILLGAAVAFGGCGSSSGGQSSSGPAPSQESAPATSASQAATESEAPANGSKVIYVIGKENQYNHWLAIKRGSIEAGEALGYQVNYLAPAGGETDIEAQVSQVETAISANPAAIVLAANDVDALAGACAKVQAAGIPMVMVDSGISTDDYDVLVGLDNYAAAQAVADELAGKMGGKGKIGIISAVTGAQTIQLREKGFMDRIAEKYPDIEIVGEILYSQNDTTKAMNCTYDILTAYPDVNALYTVNTATAEGIASALQEQGVAGTVLLGNFDCSDTINDYISKGIVNACSVAKAYDMGHIAVECAVKLANGEPLEGAENKFINSGAVVVTPDNYNDAEVQKLLNPLS